MGWLLVLVLGCASTPTYIVQGTVVSVGTDEVVIDHREIEGFMGAMTMPFAVDDPGLLVALEPGHQVIGRIAVDGTDVTLEKLRVTGKGPAPVLADGPAPLAVGEAMPAMALALSSGETLTLGPDQQRPVVLTFLYTRCPDPTFCPTTVARLNALQDAAGDVALVALTLDPEHDTTEVLQAWTAAQGATGWVGARASDDDTRTLAMLAGLPVARGATGEIVHQLRWLALDRGGVLRVRHDDNEVDAAALLNPLR